VNISRILQPLNDTLLASLTGAEGIVFAGDRATIDYLRDFFAASEARSSHEYVCVEDGPPAQWLPTIGDRRIVVASARREDAIFRQVTDAHGRGPVLRLFADLFVNLTCGDSPMQSAEGSPPILAYAIVGTPRCGSEFLCNVLTSTGRAGFPEEHLRLESQMLTRYGRFDCARYFRALTMRRQTPNGVFGTKIISHFLREHARLDPKLRRDLRQLRYIHIVRQDRLGQAISALIASKTGIWHVRNEADQERHRQLLGSVTVDDDDLLRVNRLMGSFRRQDRKLAKFISKRRISHMTVTYERLVEDPAQHLASILAFLNLDVPAPDVAVTVKPTRSALSDTIRARYHDSIYGRRRARRERILRALGLK
jgi:LPS sulfotransferase NodH